MNAAIISEKLIQGLWWLDVSQRTLTMANMMRNTELDAPVEGLLRLAAAQAKVAIARIENATALMMETKR